MDTLRLASVSDCSFQSSFLAPSSQALKSRTGASTVAVSHGVSRPSPTVASQFSDSQRRRYISPTRRPAPGAAAAAPSSGTLYPTLVGPASYETDDEGAGTPTCPFEADAASRVITVSAWEEFDSLLAAASARGQLVVVETTLSSLPNTAKNYPKLQQIARVAPGRTLFLRLMADRSDVLRDLAKSLGVKQIPSYSIFRDGQMVHEEPGMDVDRLLLQLQYYSSSGSNLGMNAADRSEGGSVYSGSTDTEQDGKVLELNGREDFYELLRRHENDDRLVVLKATLTFCGPCVRIHPTVVKLAQRMSDTAVLARVFGDNNESTVTLMRELNIVEAPTFLFYRRGELLGRYVGSGRGALLVRPRMAFAGWLRRGSSHRRAVSALNSPLPLQLLRQLAPAAIAASYLAEGLAQGSPAAESFHSRATGVCGSGGSAVQSSASPPGGWRHLGNQGGSGEEDSDNDHSVDVTPWVRSVASGVDLLRNPKYNKGLAFTEEERNRLYLNGLLPAGYMSQDHQVDRVLANLKEAQSDLQRYVHLMALQERNERLFYRVLVDHVEQLMPIVYTPTVGLACERFGLLFRRPRGLFVSQRDRGRVMELLKNWPERRVRAIVVTDGERVLGLGDLGVQGMAIAVGKLTLYTACGGIHPAECLPVTIDVGTNNQALLKDPFYPGLRQPRATGEEYDELIDEFMEACKQRFGSDVLIQFEDFANHNAFRLLFQYRGSHLVFNDDIQGTASVALAGLLASLPLLGSSLSNQTILFFGAGEAGTGIAELLATAISREANISLAEARGRIWLVDSKGLVVRSRVDSLQPHKVPFAHDHPESADLVETIHAIRPTALIGVSGQAGTFTQPVCEAMAQLNERPIVFALSNPTSLSECTAEDAYKWTQGRAIFASGSPFAPVEMDGRRFVPGQGNNAYVFPGIGLGCLMCGATRMRDEMFLAAAEALAAQVSDDDREQGRVYPPIWKIRQISAHIARAVAAKAYDLGVATNLPRPPDLLSYAFSKMYNPHYRSFR
ncbi:unnamed protein product [Closterium sp. Naga37s-1]|nr:unnamed protein product [Closterium sp. Naga37s-1]